jgi:hypothetical protein
MAKLKGGFAVLFPAMARDLFLYTRMGSMRRCFSHVISIVGIPAGDSAVDSVYGLIFQKLLFTFQPFLDDMDFTAFNGG